MSGPIPVGTWPGWERGPGSSWHNPGRYTVEYLRDKKGVHNFLYVYGPGSEAESLSDYAERYPGDSYVDIVGFDMYDSDPDVNSGWMTAFKRELELVSQFADEHSKLVAVTETGVANAAWFYDAVEYAAARNLMSGIGNGLFAPHSALTRAMIVQVLYSMEGKPEISGESTFWDAADGTWCAEAVKWAVSNEIVASQSSTQFGAQDQVTREEMVVVLYNYAKMKGWDVASSADLSAFSDAGSISSWALDAVRWANGEGLLTGTDDKRIAPSSKLTRAQLAAILKRFCEK